MATWIEVKTGLRLDEQGSVQVLDNAAWRKQRDRLATQGGPPDMGGLRRLDPILFGDDPTARAKAWIERERWIEAEAAFDEVVRTRPYDPAFVIERGRFHASRSQVKKAADDYVHAISLFASPKDLAKDILDNPAIRDRVFSLSPELQDKLYDAIFPANAFAR
jgi:hypothetical protein